MCPYQYRFKTPADTVPGLLDYVTILDTPLPNAYNMLHHDPLGRVFFDDAQQSGHKRYGIDLQQGAVVVLRPDGWVGTMMRLGASTRAELEQYFERIFEQ